MTNRAFSAMAANHQSYMIRFDGGHFDDPSPSSAGAEPPGPVQPQPPFAGRRMISPEQEHQVIVAALLHVVSGYTTTPPEVFSSVTPSPNLAAAAMDAPAASRHRQLATSHRGHGSQFHPLQMGANPYAGQEAQLVAAPGYFQGADGNSTASIQAFCVNGDDDLDPDAETRLYHDDDLLVLFDIRNTLNVYFSQPAGEPFAAGASPVQQFGAAANWCAGLPCDFPDGFGPNGRPVSVAPSYNFATGLAVSEQFVDAYWNAPGVHHLFSRDGDVLTDDSSVTAAGVRSPLFAPIVLHRVWHDNCEEVFQRVVDKLREPRRRLYIALDLEYVADASTDVGFRPICWNTWYQHLRAFVDAGKMVQVGIAFAFELEEDHQPGRPPSSTVMALEINMKIDVNAREHNGASISFLEDHGHRLEEYRDRGVAEELFLNGLLRHLPVGDDSVTWITYHGERDFGFLLRLLQPGGRGALPPGRATFIRQVHDQFAIFYDVRVLGQLEKEGFTGSLTALAAHLGVQRIGIGGDHHAGSDALLTLSCFKEIHRRNKHKLRQLDSRQCLLSGMEELDMGIKCAHHIDDASVVTIHVRGHNFDDEAWRIDELVRSNFKIVGVHVQLPPSTFDNNIYDASADAQKDYDLMKSRLEGIDEFQVTFGFMNAEGMLAYGRLWKFYLRCSSARVDLAGDENGYVHPGRLAWLMASCSATHNPNVAWVTYQGSLGIACLIKSFVAAGDLPSDWCSYIQHQQGCFPCLCDVGLIAQACPDIGEHPLGMLAPQAHLVLRCYKRLAETPYFALNARAVCKESLWRVRGPRIVFGTYLMEDS